MSFLKASYHQFLGLLLMFPKFHASMLGHFLLHEYTKYLYLKARRLNYFINRTKTPFTSLILLWEVMSGSGYFWKVKQWEIKILYLFSLVSISFFVIWTIWQRLGQLLLSASSCSIQGENQRTIMQIFHRTLDKQCIYLILKQPFKYTDPAYQQERFRYQ